MFPADKLLLFSRRDDTLMNLVCPLVVVVVVV
jgi:hypothetical protein